MTIAQNTYTTSNTMGTILITKLQDDVTELFTVATKYDDYSLAADGGSANTYTMSTENTISSYADGHRYLMRVANANTGASTLDIDSQGAKAIKRTNGAALEAGDLSAGVIADLVWDNSNDYFVLLNSLPSIATEAQTAQTAAETAQTNAETAETNAAASESAASTSETNAGTSETNAAASASAASTSETNAGTSETNAAASESAASTSETNAASSASAASTSETNAASSESAASTSETNAAASESAASTSETNAAASYDSFDDRYLGTKASDPSVDNDGDALLTGALYFNTINDQMKVYDGDLWGAVAATVDNTAYNATSWNNNTDAATKNAIRDKFESLTSTTVLEIQVYS